MIKKLIIIMLTALFSFSMAAVAQADVHWELEPTGQYGPVAVGEIVTLKVRLVNGDSVSTNIEGYCISFHYDPAELTWTGTYTNTPQPDLIADMFQTPDDVPPNITHFNAFMLPSGHGYPLGPGESTEVGTFDFEVIAPMGWDGNVDIDLYYATGDGVNHDQVTTYPHCLVQGPDVGVGQTFPDLVITEVSPVWINPADITEGYNVNYTVKNQGGATAGASETCLDIDGINQGSQPCDALNPNETYSGTFEGPFFCSDSSDTIEVCADCNGDVAESDEDNNCRENEWTCSAVSEPDLVISEKSEEWIDPSDPSQGYKVHYTVKNQGTAAAGVSTTCLFIDDMVNSVASQVCPALDPGDTYSGTCEGPFTCDGDSDTIKVCADWGASCDGVGVVAESDDTNNCRENEWTCAALTFDIGNGAGEPGVTDRTVAVSLKNDVAVAGIQVDICDAGDYLSLPNADDVELTARAAGFSVAFEDDYPVGDCARLVLYSEGGSVIAAGDGPIFILHYDVDAGATAHSCVEIASDNLLITDDVDEPLTAAEDPGAFLLGIYGDLWPYDDVNGTVGDGEVNIFDVVRDVQIILGTYTPVDCEFVAGDVPTGFGTDCEAPDGEIGVSDVVEMVAKILGRDNCIDLY